MVFAATTIVSFFKVNNHAPLENFKAKLEYHAEDHSISADGHYDRPLRCNLYEFNVFVTNVDTNDSYMLGANDLKVAPPGYQDPGKKLPVHMELYLPESLEDGEYNAKFNGKYHCSAGLINQDKILQLFLNNIIVKKN